MNHGRAGGNPPPAWPAVLLILVAGLLAYAGSYRGAFVFDDFSAIVENAGIQTLSPIGKALWPPSDTTLSGRPLVSLSLALNHALGGLDARGYHAVNNAIHLLAALLLFGVIRRTLRMPRFRDELRAQADAFALAVSLLWVVHPLLTESVTHISARAELMMGLFYLLTLHAAIRGFQSGRRARWWIAAVTACALGTMSGPVMVSAPIVVLVHDRLFVAGSFRAALGRHRGLYLGLAGTWVILALLQIGAARSGSVRLDLAALGPLDYFRTQLGVIVHYLRLSLWPHPLVIDYHDWPIARDLSIRVLAPGALLLALAAVPVGLAAVALGVMTWDRNLDYASEVGMGRVTVARRPLNDRAHVRLGTALVRAGELEPAVEAYTAATGLNPASRAAFSNLGSALSDLGRTADAIAAHRRAIEIAPDARAHFNLGNTYARANDLPAAAASLEDALALDPDLAPAHRNLGLVRLGQGNIAGAAFHLERAMALEPRDAESHAALSRLRLAQQRPVEALRLIDRAAELAPADLGIRHTQAGTLIELGRAGEAVGLLQSLVREHPTDVQTRVLLGRSLAITDRPEQAIAFYESAIRLDPDAADAHYLLGGALHAMGRVAAGAAEYREALRLRPDGGDIAARLAWVLATTPDPSLRSPTEAVALAERAVRLTGGRHPSALDVLAASYAAAGRFDDAVATAERAAALALERGTGESAARIGDRLDMYRRNQPYVDVTLLDHPPVR